MNPLTDEQILERLQELPPDVQGVIRSDQTKQLLEKMGAKYLLNPNQLTVFKNAVHLVLLQFRNQEDFTDDITEALSLPPALAQKIAAEVTQFIFNPPQSTPAATLSNIRGILGKVAAKISPSAPLANPATPRTSPVPGAPGYVQTSGGTVLPPNFTPRSGSTISPATPVPKVPVPPVPMPK